MPSKDLALSETKTRVNALGHVNHSKAGASQWKQASCGTNALLGKDRRCTTNKRHGGTITSRG